MSPPSPHLYLIERREEESTMPSHAPRTRQSQMSKRKKRDIFWGLLKVLNFGTGFRILAE